MDNMDNIVCLEQPLEVVEILSEPISAWDKIVLHVYCTDIAHGKFTVITY